MCNNLVHGDLDVLPLPQDITLPIYTDDIMLIILSEYHEATPLKLMLKNIVLVFLLLCKDTMATVTLDASQWKNG